MMKLIAIAAMCLMVSACSVKFELGYHGETGRDDRTMTSEQKQKNRY